MTSIISHTTIDCADPYRLSLWWNDVLGYTENPDDPNAPDHVECVIQNADGSHRLLFIKVDDPKLGKNRVHFDLQPTDGTRDAEVDRLMRLGATHVADQRNPDGTGWVVLADPEGNEFCVLRGEAERRAATTEPATTEPDGA